MKINLSMVQRYSERDFNILARVSIWCHMSVYLGQVIRKWGLSPIWLKLCSVRFLSCRGIGGNYVSTTFNC